ncbi:S8 family serine peptidase, partial [Xenorhabdus sp. 18]|nr:S8 family serine peptidase [Xenorhabdus sp. 18]
MKKFIMIAVLLFGLCSGSVTSFASELSKKDDYLIMFRDKIDENLIEKQGGEVKETYSNLPIVKAEFPYDPTKTLKQYFEVLEVEQDGNVKANGTKQSLHNGVSSVLSTKGKGVSPLTGKGIAVAVLDTGIDREHPDVKIKDGVSFVENVLDFDDDNGHGTHLAGIIG